MKPCSALSKKFMWEVIIENEFHTAPKLLNLS